MRNNSNSRREAANHWMAALGKHFSNYDEYEEELAPYKERATPDIIDITCTKKLATTQLAELNKKNLDGLINEELVGRGITLGTLTVPKPPRQPKKPVKYGAEIAKMAKSFNVNGLEIASNKVSNLIQGIINNSSEHDKEYIAKCKAFEEKEKRYAEKLTTFNELHKVYVKHQKLLGDIRHTISTEIDDARSLKKNIATWAPVYLKYLDLCNGDKAIARKFLGEKYPRSKEVKNFSSFILEYTLDNVEGG